jgi:AcrR family transcriptional regulator
MQASTFAPTQSDPVDRAVRTRTPRAEKTRRRILGAAEYVFGDKGYYATSISDITSRANVAQGTLYLYYPGKLALFVELFDQLGHDMRVQLHQATEAATGRLAKERAGLRAYFDYAARHPRIYRIAHEAQCVVPERFDEWCDQVMEPYERALQAATLSGEIRPLDTKLMVYALLGIADYVGVQLILRHRLHRVPDAAIDVLCDFIANGLMPQTPIPKKARLALVAPRTGIGSR